jgi:hypothetical protein
MLFVFIEAQNGSWYIRKARPPETQSNCWHLRHSLCVDGNQVECHPSTLQREGRGQWAQVFFFMQTDNVIIQDYKETKVSHSYVLLSHAPALCILHAHKLQQQTNLIFLRSTFQVVASSVLIPILCAETRISSKPVPQILSIKISKDWLLSAFHILTLLFAISLRITFRNPSNALDQDPDAD